MQIWRAGGDESQLRPLRVRNERLAGDGRTARCRRCGEWKALSEFPEDASPGRVVQRECYPCKAKAQREWNAEHPESVRKTILKRKGITPEDYDKMLAEQDGRCAICRTDKPRSGRAFAVDHNHRTGKGRGLLCESCNRGIGYLGDDPARLDAAAAYLRAH